MDTRRDARLSVKNLFLRKSLPTAHCYQYNYREAEYDWKEWVMSAASLQEVEKSLKALLIRIGVDSPWTHSIARPAEFIEGADMEMAGFVKDSVA